MFGLRRFERFHKLRYVICLSAWLTLLALYSQRANLSMGILGMTKPKASKAGDPNCPKMTSKSPPGVQEKTERFVWDESMQNYVLLAYNVGYMIGHVPGAFLSVMYGSRKVMLVCTLGSTILTFISIFVARYQWIFFGIRSLIGLFNGPLYPLIHQTIATHAPPSERTLLTMITHTGNIVSLILVLPVGGLLIDNIPNGWKYLFYMTAGLGLISTLMWFIFVYSDPDENPLMSYYEQDYIIRNIYPNGKPPKKTLKNVPFKAIFSSRHLYIFTIVHFGKLLILYMNLFGIVKYLHTFFGLTPTMAGYLAVIPFLADFFFQLIYPKIVDLMKKRHFNLTAIRRINTFIGALGCSAFLTVASLVNCTDLVLGIILQTLSLMFLAPYQAGYFTAIIEFAPQYSSITFSFINIGGTLSGVAQRYLTALLTQNILDIREAYKISFIITGLASFLCSLVYVIFGTAKLQPWASTKPKKRSTESKDEEESESSDISDYFSGFESYHEESESSERRKNFTEFLLGKNEESISNDRKEYLTAFAYYEKMFNNARKILTNGR